MDVLVKCDYHTAGCPWTGQLKNWEVRREERGRMVVLALSIHSSSLSSSPLAFAFSPPPFFLLLPPSQNHIDVCVYRTVTCPNKGCEAVLPYHQLESHEQNCSFRRVTCEHCDTEIICSELEVRKRGFQLECTRFSWVCQNLFFPMQNFRRQMTSHNVYLNHVLIS